MRIFILEDSAFRLQEFWDRFADDDLTVAKNLPTAMEKFHPPYDLILLDHDLERAHYKNLQTEEGTGTEFARHLSTLQPFCPIVVHSHNFYGRRRMVGDLTRSGWKVYDQPYGPSLFRLIITLRSTPNGRI